MEVQVGEHTWIGHGESEVYSGFYYNANGQGAALAAAIADALEEIGEARRREFLENLGASR